MNTNINELLVQVQVQIKETNTQTTSHEKCRLNLQGVFLHWASPKKLKYGKPRLGEFSLT